MYIADPHLYQTVWETKKHTKSYAANTPIERAIRSHVGLRSICVLWFEHPLCIPVSRGSVAEEQRHPSDVALVAQGVSLAVLEAVSDVK